MAKNYKKLSKLLFFFLFLVNFDSLHSDEPPVSKKSINRTLEKDPSVLSKIESLGDNEMVKLPLAKIVGEFNDEARKFEIDKTGPKIRNYCIKMVWAPERQRGLYLGGNHGVPHKLNDVWEFDLSSNTWSLLYAPDTNRNQHGNIDDWVFKDGILQAKSGAPAQVAHTWSQVTYDPEIKAVLWMNSWNIDGGLGKLGLLELWKSDKNRHRIPLWAYFPETNSWKPLGLDQYPFAAGNASLLEYVPDLKSTLWCRANSDSATWLYEAKTDLWKHAKPKSDVRVTDEMISCYDRMNKLVIAQVTDFRKDTSHNTFQYSPTKNMWEKTISAANDSGLAPMGFDATTVFTYDSINGVCLLYNPPKAHKSVDDKAFGLWAFNAKTQKWSKLEPKGAILENGLMTGYFDENLNAFVLIKDASTQVWVYRFKKAK